MVVRVTSEATEKESRSWRDQPPMASNCLSRRVLLSDEATRADSMDMQIASTRLAKAQAAMRTPQSAITPVASPAWRW